MWEELEDWLLTEAEKKSHETWVLNNEKVCPQIVRGRPAPESALINRRGPVTFPELNF
jgi:hypothetical protein